MRQLKYLAWFQQVTLGSRELTKQSSKHSTQSSKHSTQKLGNLNFSSWKSALACCWVASLISDIVLRSSDNVHSPGITS